MEIDDEITTDDEWIIAKRDTGHVAIHVPKGSINDVIHRYTATAKPAQDMLDDEASVPWRERSVERQAQAGEPKV